jgi:CheY-like chemotaxis protein
MNANDDSSVAVLVVEDDAELRAALEMLLQIEGYTTAGVGNGKEALDWLRTYATLPSVILLDLMMPVMDGHQFVEQIDDDPVLKAIPVIIMGATARGSDPTVSRVSLPKPMDFEQLFAAVNRFVIAGRANVARQV